MTNENDRNDNNRTKLEFYMDEGIAVHVDLINKIFYNGKIVKKVKDGVYIIQDQVLGPQHIFLNEIYKVDEFREPKERPKFNNF